MKALIKRLIPKQFWGWYHFSLALRGAIRYGFPSKKLIVIGVTGTDGKSTTTEMIVRVLKEAGYKTASTSSVWFQIGDAKEKNPLKMSMPGKSFLQSFLAKAVKEGCTHAVLEVSSEGILQHRHRFIDFHTAVFTNIYPEHIERHGSFEKYLSEKQKLFRAAKQVHVINTDDKNAPQFLKFGAKHAYGFGFGEKQKYSEVEKYIRAESVEDTKNGVRFLVNGTQFQLQLLGWFNAMNALAAICVADSQNIPLAKAKTALEKMDAMPGRMEVVIREPFTVIVDYAVTPEAYENLYKAARQLFQPRKMIAVFGAAGGGRDTWKRPLLGKIAAEYCDEIILTNEDPYDEDPLQILSEIKSGITNTQFPMTNVLEILDRREAIRKALSIAKEGDVVVLTGKGSEDAIAVAGGKKIPWSERGVVEEEIKKIGAGT
ncbi:MAG: UDP-N-acetylmuramoyl-L-alanyl-D-glutamate--2,6-diaminopimelate ligase [Candidatus Wildermuthbacteria bacterium]|nr:UDP-N-acetylmuramoyl-L-alanyl-D-glutamate--2,6-diaminopimelate ligase [Candidatus Wildermuthbacteria bacterium]